MPQSQLSIDEAASTTVELPHAAPNLIVIGAMKASTTTFYELITRHPNIWFPSEKEPHYFTSPDFGKPAAWQKYLRLFDSAPASARVIGEASTGYSKIPHFGNTPERLRDVLGQPKLIYLVRDPVERTISNYQHSYLAGHYAPGTTLAEAIYNDPILISASLYARQIRAYQEVFDPRRFLVFPVEQLHAEPATVMRHVETFLELPGFAGWENTLPQSNSKQSLNSSLTLQAWVPKSLLNAIRKLLPKTVRQRLKSLTRKSPKLPPITDADRRAVFEAVADDLRDFLTEFGDELAPWIDSWPSVLQLRAQPTSER